MQQFPGQVFTNGDTIILKDIATSAARPFSLFSENYKIEDAPGHITGVPGNYISDVLYRNYHWKFFGDTFWLINRF